MKLLITIFVTLLLFLSSTYTAKAGWVFDGDTITVLTDNKKQIRVILEDTFYEVFMTLERDGIDKVEMLGDKKKLDFYIGNYKRQWKISYNRIIILYLIRFQINKRETKRVL